jgi:protein involved in polysaccharide export with SLBB domain
MVLAHELAHVRRWDNLVNLAQRLVESLLFFHPCVWLASRQVRRDREECCDALVVRHTARPEAYATLLVSIAAAVRARRAPQLAAASAMADHPLAGRVRRILKLEDETMRVSRRSLAMVVAALVAVLGGWYYHAAQAEEIDPNRSGAAAENADIHDNEVGSPRQLTKEQRAKIKTLQKPNEIPAAVLVFPVGPDVVSQRIRELNSLGHNVRLANGEGFTVLFVPRLEPYAEPNETLEAEIELLRRALARDLARWGSGHPAIKQREALIAALEQELRGEPTTEPSATLDDLLAVLERVKAARKAKLEELKQEAAGDPELMMLQADIEAQETLALQLEQKILEWQNLQADAEQGDDHGDMPESLRDSSHELADVIERLWAQVLDGVAEESDEYRELETLRAAIGGFLEKRFAIARELAELDTFWKSASDSAYSPAAMESAVAAVMEKDPSIAMYQQQLFELNQQIRLMESSTKNTNITTLKRLRQQYAYTEAAMKSYQTSAEEETRKKLRSVPNEALRAAYAEYTLRKESALARASALKGQFDKHLHTLQGDADETSVRAQLVNALRRQFERIEELAPQDADSAPPYSAGPGDPAMPLTLMEPLPAGLDEDDGHRIVDELNDAGHRARLVNEGDKFAIAVTPQPDRDDVVWRAVWEEDGEGMHCRLVASDLALDDEDAPAYSQSESSEAGAPANPDVDLSNQIQEARSALTRERARWGDGHPSVKLLASALAELEQRWKEKKQAFGQADTRTLDFRLPEWMTPDDARRLARELRDQGYEAIAVLTDDGIRMQVPEFPANLDLRLEVSSSGSTREFKLRVVPKEHPTSGGTPGDPNAAAPQEPAEDSPDPPAAEEHADDDPAAEPGSSAAMFAASDVNPLVTQVHQIPPALKERSIEAFPDVFERYRTDPHGPRTPNLAWRWLVEGETIEITAPRLFQEEFARELRAPEGDRGASPPTGHAKPQAAEEGTGGPLLSTDDQTIADLAYRTLGLEVEPLIATDEERTLLNELGFGGGVRIIGVRGGSAYTWHAGDILAGVHTWPIADMTALGEVLAREELAELSPVKCIVASPALRQPKVVVRLEVSGGGANPAAMPPHRLGPGDVISISGLEGLGQTDPMIVTIEDVGTAPLGHMVGRIKVLGRTVLEVEEGIRVRIMEKGLISNPSVQVTLVSKAGDATEPSATSANEGDGNPSPSPSLRGRGTREPHTLAAGDVVLLRVVGALSDAPLDDELTIEPAGAIPLGPAYGRVDVAGLTLLEAESAIKKHLQTILANVELQLTLVAAANDASAAGDAAYLYDGRSFDQWKELWKTELKTDRRVEALHALAQFGRTSHPVEATSAILDVAAQLSFTDLDDETADNRMEHAVLGALSDTPPGPWLEGLRKRIASDSAAWAPLAALALERITVADEDLAPHFRALAEIDDRGVKLQALAQLKRVAPAETEKWILHLLASKYSEEICMGLELLSSTPKPHSHWAFQDQQVPAIVELAIAGSQHERVSQAARRALHNLSGDFGPSAAVVKLCEILQGDADEGTQRRAIRALAATARQARHSNKHAESVLQQMLASPHREVQVAAAFALCVINRTELDRGFSVRDYEGFMLLAKQLMIEAGAPEFDRLQDEVVNEEVKILPAPGRVFRNAALQAE